MASEPQAPKAAAPADRRKLRQAQRERLRANHVGTLRRQSQSSTATAASAGRGRAEVAANSPSSDLKALAKLKEVRQAFEGRGELNALSPEEEVALEAPDVETVQVQLKRVEDGSSSFQSGAAPSAGEMCLPPNLARGLLPNEVLSYAHVPSATSATSTVAVATPWQLREAPAPRQTGPAASMYPTDYSSMWSSVVQQAPSRVPVAAIETSYESVLSQTVGPAAMDVDAFCSIKDFGRGIAEGRNTYSNQSREVVLPPGRVDYGRQMAKLELPPQNVFGPHAQMQARQRLDAAIETNVNIREALQRSVCRMQRAIPRQRGEEMPDSPTGSSPRSNSPPKVGAYHKVKLEIEVVKASNVPDSAILATCDPYVIVSVVDGNPLQDAHALKDYEDWRALHEQWSGQTRVVEGARDPEFRARFRAEVRHRETTHLHFRLLDQDNISQDRNIGQAVLPLSDLMDDSWAAVRAMALRPMDRKDANAWAAIAQTRLHVAVNWEGVLGKVKSEERLRAATKWQAGHAKRAQRRVKEDQGEGGLLDFFG